MKKIILALLLLLLWLPFFVTAQTETLTNADVLKMSKLDLPASSIVNKIKISQTKFDVSVDALLELKKQGVNIDVINSMMDASSNATKEKAGPIDAQRVKNPMDLTKKGNKVFIEPANDDSREGEKYFSITLKAWGYWNIVGDQEQADFIIVYHEENKGMGRRAVWAILERNDKDKKEFLRTDIYKEGSTAFNGYNAHRAAADKLINKYFKDKFE